MEKRLILRGLVAGASGGLLAFVFARVLAEPLVDRAVSYEHGRSEAAHAEGVHEHGVELFTRGVQGNAGLGFGTLLFGIAMGALFAVLFCVAYGRTGSVEPQRLSLRLAAGTFLAVYLVPFVKYPPNPPAVGQADSIGSRTLWYLVMVLMSVALAIAAAWLARQLASRLGTFTGGLIAGSFYIVMVALVMLVLPSVDETPAPMRDAAGTIIYPGFPADVLYEFRLVALGTQLVMWLTVGVVFAALADRLLGERESGRVARTAA
ncbi:cobalt transporter subunit CbtA (proposed) [Mycobacterium basiliense]|uniref:Cobalt transporter subunit CbtA (Proposed) n=1 Tax=Mycobacterium basiliense TaxID=2094119 RepID=A0A3S4BZV2_9MYCO|nr:CbtA family protein [Mycobacterium basiliense]VDM90888.1 cobalt transporter subunit CbtA (proposed) [Mycobacterium basiliense]